MTSPRQREIAERWTRITDQSIGEAQNTIEDLIELLEAARADVTDCPSCRATLRGYGTSGCTHHANWHASVGQKEG